MNALEASKLIGTSGWWKTTEGFSILVQIKDVKSAYGKDRYLITPVHGLGEVWTEKKPNNKNTEGL